MSRFYLPQLYSFPCTAGMFLVTWALNCKLCFLITRPLGSEPSHLSRILFFNLITDEPRTRWEVSLIFWWSFWKNLCRSPERIAPMDIWKIKSLFLICIDSLLTSPELPQPEITKIPLIFFFTISLFKTNGLTQFWENNSKSARQHW